MYKLRNTDTPQNGYSGDTCSLYTAHEVDVLKAATEEIITAETTRAKTVESSLSSKIDLEISRAKTVEGTLALLKSGSSSLVEAINYNYNSIKSLSDSTSSSLMAEIGRAKSAEALITSSFNSESSRAKSAEAALVDSVNAQYSVIEKFSTTFTARMASYEATVGDLTGLEESIQDTSIVRSLNKENLRALAAEQSLSSAITHEAQRAKVTEGVLTNLDTSIKIDLVSAVNEVLADVNNEARNRGLADETLSSKITAESEARESADSSLQTKIDNEASYRAKVDAELKSSIETETSERKSADTTLQTNIDTETARAESVEGILGNLTTKNKASLVGAVNSLVTDLASETTARQSADSTLQSNINAETLARQNADATLQTNINNEVTARKAADTVLQTNIDNEATARQNADTVLQTNINALRTYVDETFVPLSQKGSANGVVPLNAASKIDSIYLNFTPLDYLGTIDSSSELESSPDKGDFYIISADFTYGGVTYQKGDWILYNGRAWEQSENSCDVNSVNGYTGVVVLHATDIYLDSTSIVTVSDKLASLVQAVSDETTARESADTLIRSDMTTALTLKQDKLTAGKNISISDTNEISASSTQIDDTLESSTEYTWSISKIKSEMTVNVEQAITHVKEQLEWADTFSPALMSGGQTLTATGWSINGTLFCLSGYLSVTSTSQIFFEVTDSCGNTTCTMALYKLKISDGTIKDQKGGTVASGDYYLKLLCHGSAFSMNRTGLYHPEIASTLVVTDSDDTTKLTLSPGSLYYACILTSNNGACLGGVTRSKTNVKPYVSFHTDDIGSQTLPENLTTQGELERSYAFVLSREHILD